MYKEDELAREYLRSKEPATLYGTRVNEAAMEMHKLLSTLQVYVDEMQPAALKALTTSGLMSTNPELLFELYGDEAVPMLSSHRHVFNAASVIHCLQHAGMLKSDAHLRDAIKLSLYQALPSGLIPPMIEALEHQRSPGKIRSVGGGFFWILPTCWYVAKMLLPTSNKVKRMQGG